MVIIFGRLSRFLTPETFEFFCFCSETMECFLNEAELSLNSVNSAKLINHLSINLAQFKDSVSHVCLAGAMVASWSLTQEVVGLIPFNDNYFLFLNSLNSVKTFRKICNMSQ